MSSEQFPIRFPRDGIMFETPHWVINETPAWIEHIPFAFWLTSVMRPRVLVELGSHYANSYFAFAQSVSTIGSATAMYAVDTWAGDEHSGFYGDEVFDAVSCYNDEHYSSFSSLVRSTFDDALDHFSEGEVDLLHLDGHHSYESVKHDFESWLPKMSERGVVIFHDVAVRERDFGVFRLWNELTRAYPSFSFVHGHGLGIVGVGSDLPDTVDDLLSINPESDDAAVVRLMFSELGRRLSHMAKAEERIAAVQAEAEGRVAVVQADAEGRVAVVQADAEGRVAVVQADAEGRIAVVQADAEERIAVVQASHLDELEREREMFRRQIRALEVQVTLADSRACRIFDDRLSQLFSDTSGEARR